MEQSLEALMSHQTAWFWQPINIWRAYASLFRSVLGAAGRLGNDRPALERDWRAIVDVTNRYWGGIEREEWEWSDEDPDEPAQRLRRPLSLDSERTMLSIVVDELLGLADFMPRLV